MTKSIIKNFIKLSNFSKKEEAVEALYTYIIHRKNYTLYSPTKVIIRVIELCNKKIENKIEDHSLNKKKEVEFMNRIYNTKTIMNQLLANIKENYLIEKILEKITISNIEYLEAKLYSLLYLELSAVSLWGISSKFILGGTNGRR